MINKNELLFVVDENNKAQKSLPRYLVHQNNFWHRTTAIWVVNNKKQILCQKRSLQKDTKPGFWECFFGGHIGPHESYLDNAINELSQELGIFVQKQDLLPYNVLKSDKSTHKEFQYIYIYKLNREDTYFSYEKEEIDQLKWIDIKTIKKYLLKENKPDWVHKPWDKKILLWIENL